MSLSDLSTTIKTSIVEGTTFGPVTNPKLGSLAIKILSLLIPGVLFGHYLDAFVNKLKKDKALGPSTLSYIALQTLLGIVVVWVLINTYKPYTDEFQNTLPGLFFVSLFFGMQTNYVANIQSILPV